jgi:superfamily II DNA or RNA helicase
VTGLRAHQIEPVNDIVRALTLRPGQDHPASGLRTQLHAAPGTGKTLMSAHAANRLARRGRVLVLVPTLDLLGQTIDAWRAAGRGGRMYAVCSLQDHEPAVGVLCTTSPVRLAFWLAWEGEGRPVTVFGTYASLPTITAAHLGGLGVPPASPWSLVVCDEAHRVSGSSAKAWTAAHDNQQLPALRRLYMTATPRIWDIPDLEPLQPAQPSGQAEEGAAEGTGQLPPAGVPSLPKGLAMSMDDESVFGPVCNNTLTLARCQELGILARFQLIALEISDPVLADMLEAGAGADDAVREARLAAVQVALLKAIRDESLKKVISFHDRVSDAEVFATTLPGQVESDPDLRAAYPDGIWARWLCGEHTGRHRRHVLGEFDSEQPGGRERPALLANVRILGEGVDGKSDAVVFLTPKSSVVDLVQAVGRALRQHPGQGKTASIIVPVIVHRPGTGTVEDAAGGGDLIADPAFRPLMDVLSALRSYDNDLVQGLAVPQRRSRTEQPSPWIDTDDEHLDTIEAGEEGGQPRMVLRFAGAHHTPAEIAAAVRLRVLTPEAQTWLRAYAHALRWHQRFGDLAVPTTATALPEPGGRTSDFPLGRWVTDMRAAHARGDLLPSRIQKLEELGIVWNAHEAAWDANLAAATAWAEANGVGLAAPATARWEQVPVGRWLSTMRSAARRVPQDGGLTESRRKRLEEVDPWWNPPWPIAWQRAYRIAHAHTANGGTLTDLHDGHLINGEDIGRWAREQRAQWADLGAQRQQMLTALGLTPPNEQETAEQDRPRHRSRDARFTTGLEAARAWHTQHGTIANVRRTDTVQLPTGQTIKLGIFLMNLRQRATKLHPEQRTALDALGMRW